jgi:hypothetical protein
MERREEKEEYNNIYACRFCKEEFKRFSRYEKHLNFCYDSNKTALSKRVISLIEKNNNENRKNLHFFFSFEEKEWIKELINLK